MKFWSNKTVLVTGSHGFVGTQLIKQLNELRPKQLLTPTHQQVNLSNRQECLKITKSVDLVIHLAAKVGGIGLNQEIPGEMFYQNLIMGVELMEAARINNVKKFVTIGTVCAYPKFTPVPFKESDLWNGYPEETNAPYGLAKKMLLVQGQAYRQQYGFNAIYLLPANMYGPGDNFDDHGAHVIPDLIRKFTQAKQDKSKTVTLWGTGKATREFLYVKDAARGILLASEKYNQAEPVNLGSSFEISIKDLADKIKKLTGFTGKIVWDKTKPDGQPKRHLDVSRAKKEFGFVSEVDFDDGLKETVAWYNTLASSSR